MLRVAIIGTGMMGRIHAGCYKQLRGCRVTACCDLDLKKSREFAREFNIDNYYGSVEHLLEREEIDAVSIVTPNDTHFEITVSCFEHGIPVLCEKPLAQTYDLASKMATLAKKKNIVNMVNFVHRGSPQLHKAGEIVSSGEIGRVMHVEASYLQSWMTSDYWGDWKENESFLWRLSSNHAGRGVIADFGPGLLDLVSFVAGDISSLRTDVRSFNKGVKGNKLQGYSLDSTDSAVISADFASGAMGAIHMTRWATGEMNSLRLRVYGDEGGLSLDIEQDGSFLEICSGENRHRAKWKKVKIEKVESSWQMFVNAVGQNDLAVQPSFAHAAKLQKLLEKSLDDKRS